ncbi:MAG: DciA family protein [Pseudanabaenaceae cyanobacterium]
MALMGLGAIVENLQQGSTWRLQHRFLRVLAVWPTVVGPDVVRYTRPIAIRRQVLEVATAGGAWSQALTLQRSHILVKLNAHLAEPLLDLRFSTARWRPEVGGEERVLGPTHAARPDPPPPLPAPATPLEAFARWERLRRQQTQQAVTCPRCRRPTTQSDLDRWGCCRFCIRTDWA